MNTPESLPTTLYYDLLTAVVRAQEKSELMVALLQKETSIFLDAIADDATRIAALEAKLKAMQQTYTHADFVDHLYNEFHADLIMDGFRKWEEHEEIKSVIKWLRENGIDPTQFLSAYDYAALKDVMIEEVVRFCYNSAATSYLQAQIWKLEGRMALAAGLKADTGLRWNFTAKSPFTKTDFENLMSALWEMKFITHTSGKKELAIKALYGVFDQQAPEKIGTNRYKAKATRTTSDNAYEIFDRLKAAHEQYLNSEVR